MKDSRRTWVKYLLPQRRSHLSLFFQRLDFPLQGHDRTLLVCFDLLLDIFDPRQRPVDPPELDLIEKPLEPGGLLVETYLPQLAEESDLILFLPLSI